MKQNEAITACLRHSNVFLWSIGTALFLISLHLRDMGTHILSSTTVIKVSHYFITLITRKLCIALQREVQAQKNCVSILNRREDWNRK